MFTLKWIHPFSAQFDLASVKYSYLWLNALPILEQGFHLNKQEFRDALCFCYNWQLENVHRN